MKKSQNTLWLVSVAAAVALSACGSGGSGSGVSNSNPTTPTKPTVTEFKQAGYDSKGTVSANLATATSDVAKYTYQYEGKT